MVSSHGEGATELDKNPLFLSHVHAFRKRSSAAPHRSLRSSASSSFTALFVEVDLGRDGTDTAGGLDSTCG